MLEACIRCSPRDVVPEALSRADIVVNGVFSCSETGSESEEPLSSSSEVCWISSTDLP